MIADWKKYITFALVIMFLFVSLFVVGYRFGRRVEVKDSEVQSDTLILTVRDTIRDTVRVVRKERVIDTVLYVFNDTVYVPIPVTQREYEGDNYRLWVSGYEPRLDSIDVFNTVVEKYITTTTTNYTEMQSMEYYGYVNGVFMDDSFGLGVGAMAVFPKGLLVTGSVGAIDSRIYGSLGIGLRF